MLKVDLRKTFDLVNWQFILLILKVADLPSRFVNWIKQCITSSSFSINVNGSLCGYFKGTRGLRQGDPLSTTLFVMVMEVLGNILQSKFDAGSIGFHPLGRTPQISHLAFADDIMIFFDGKSSSLQTIADSLDDFQKVSGLSMNKDKTVIFYAGLDQTEAEIINNLGFQSGTLPICYLGLPLKHTKLKKTEYSPLTDSIAARFNHWATKSLSFAGRLQLINLVIFSLINFQSSAFALPKGCLKAIEQLCNRFLWAGDMSKHAAAKVSWSACCLPKDEGGLGLRNLAAWNKNIV